MIVYDLNPVKWRQNSILLSWDDVRLWRKSPSIGKDVSCAAEAAVRGFEKVIVSQLFFEVRVRECVESIFVPSCSPPPPHLSHLHVAERQDPPDYRVA